MQATSLKVEDIEERQRTRTLGPGPFTANELVWTVYEWPVSRPDPKITKLQAYFSLDRLPDFLGESFQLTKSETKDAKLIRATQADTFWRRDRYRRCMPGHGDDLESRLESYEVWFLHHRPGYVRILGTFREESAHSNLAEPETGTCRGFDSTSAASEESAKSTLQVGNRSSLDYPVFFRKEMVRLLNLGLEVDLARQQARTQTPRGAAVLLEAAVALEAEHNNDKDRSKKKKRKCWQWRK